jgi:hypothetical protein
MWGFLNLFGYLASARFEGSIPVHLPYALAVPLNSDQQVSVTAELYHGGVIIDEVTVPYATTADKAVAAVIPILLIVGVIVFILVFRRSFVKK